MTGSRKLARATPASTYQPTGHLMIRSAIIKNFRCFRNVNLRECKRFNIVVGRNASGKTALLEAVSLPLSSSQEFCLRFRIWRGHPFNPTQLMNITGDRDLWSNLFLNFDLTKKIEISLVGSAKHTRSLTAHYDAKGFTPIQQAPGQPGTVLASPMIFDFKKPSGRKKWRVRAVPLGANYFYTGAETIPMDAAFFSGNALPDFNEAAQKFSDLSRVYRSDPVVQEIRNEFPFIQDIEPGAQVGGGSTLLLSIADSPQKFPMGYVSSGIARLICILIGIASVRGGVVAIDEIENGIFYDRYEHVWRAIFNFCKANDVQLFASTHSRECLQALVEAAEGYEKDISFIRTISSDNVVTVEQLTGPNALRAIPSQEIR